MNNFKIGDLVRRTADPVFDYRYMVSGEVYTVTGLPKDDYDSIEVNNLTERWDYTRFELYKPEPTELEEAYAKIDTLESALEDAVRELISLREGNNAAVIDLKESEFKPISEYTLEDWELAKEEGWVFETREGEHIHVLFMKPFDETPYTFKGSNDYNYTFWGSIWESSDDEEDIIKRIK